MSLLRVSTVLASVTPYSQSRPIDTAKNVLEDHEEHKKRVWMEHAHVDGEGHIFIPQMAFKNALSEAAKFISMPVKGRGKATYTKHIEAGVMVEDNLTLPITRDTLESERLFLPADGRRGGGKRVWKQYPLIREWGGEVVWLILDETITEDVFRQHVEAAGQYIGIGRFRPRNNGFYGRFRLEKMKWNI